jgi:uncharacterized membrane protein YjdF
MGDAAPMKPTRLTRGVKAVAAFTVLYLVAASVLAYTKGNQEFVFYIVVMLVLVGFVLAVHLKVRLTTLTLWGLSAWGFLHMAGGLVEVGSSGVLYNLWLIPERLKYDQVVHAFGFGLTTWVCWQVLRRHLADPAPRLGPLLVCTAAGMGFGALNEIVEFVATLTVPETNVGGYINTGWDLVANAVGATTAALLIYWHERRRCQTPFHQKR